MYVSQDPIRLSGSYKLYSYVSDPIIQLDTFGLVVWKGFSPGQLSEHYKKHIVDQNEFGSISQSEYLNRAKAFAAKVDPNISEATEGNFMIRHDKTTGELFVDIPRIGKLKHTI